MAYYEQALEVCEKIGHRPEIALTHLQMAELMREEAVSRQQSAISAPPDAPGGEARKVTADKLRAESLEHLDFAIAEFREMKMQLALERALRHKEILKA